MCSVLSGLVVLHFARKPDGIAALLRLFIPGAVFAQVKDRRIHRTDVRFLTSNAGMVTDSYTYDAFGMPITTTGTTPNDFLYSGEQYDSTLGLYYLRARYYNPATGRFLATDPFQGNLLNPLTLHKYIYIENNPVNRLDPRGTDDAGEVIFIEANATQNEAFAARKLSMTRNALRCAVEALKQDVGVGYGPLNNLNPDVFIDFTNGNIFGPGPSYEFLGCLLHYRPGEDF